jgi:hypothetical protein
MVKNGSSFELVAKLILETVTSENPILCWLTGKNMETSVANEKSVSETEFCNMIKDRAV